MAKTLADRIVTQQAFVDKTSRLAADFLRKPAQNHAIQDVRPACERFIFPQEAAEMMEGIFQDGEACRVAFAVARVPILPCWIEVGGSKGWLLAEGEHGVDAHLFLWGELADGRERAVYIAGASFDQLASPGKIEVWFSNLAREGLDGGVFTEEAMFNTLRQVVFYAAVICQPHMATTERVNPWSMGDNAASRAFARRRAQRHGGVFSFNVVKLRVPKPSDIGGDIAATHAVSPKRGHMRIGHWRLIDGKIEAYWVWVESCEAGDRALGWVSKERHVEVSTGGQRRGFAVPDFVGAKGAKVPARRKGGEA